MPSVPEDASPPQRAEEFWHDVEAGLPAHSHSFHPAFDQRKAARGWPGSNARNGRSVLQGRQRARAVEVAKAQKAAAAHQVFLRRFGEMGLGSSKAADASSGPSSSPLPPSAMLG